MTLALVARTLGRRAVARRALSTTRALCAEPRGYRNTKLVPDASAPRAAAAAADADPQNALLIKEDDADLEIAKASGAPEALQQRIVRIYQMAPSATQSGTHLTRGWRLDWDVVDNVNRWEDTLIGYASSGDYMQGTQIVFRTKEDAMRFATRQGWDYYVQEPHQRRLKVKTYADNFLHSPGPLKHIRTK